MKRFLQIITISILILSCDAISVERYMNLATELENKGRYKEAIEYHNKILKKEPQFRPSLINRGADKSALNDFEGAISDYEKILEFDSDNSLAMTNIANNYEKLKLYDKAIRYYTLALEKGDIFFQSKPSKIYISFEGKENDSDYMVNEIDILFQRGLVYLNDKKFDKAKSDLKKCIELEEYLGDCHFYLGEIFRQVDDYDNACQHYKISSSFGIKDAKEKLREYCKG